MYSEEKRVWCLCVCARCATVYQSINNTFEIETGIEKSRKKTRSHKFEDANRRTIGSKKKKGERNNYCLKKSQRFYFCEFTPITTTTSKLRQNFRKKREKSRNEIKKNHVKSEKIGHESINR